MTHHNAELAEVPVALIERCLRLRNADSTHKVPAEARNIIRAAMDAHLAKPARKSTLAIRLAAWIRHGEAVPTDVTTYDRGIVNAELRALIEEADRG